MIKVGATPVSLDRLLEESDFIAIHASLNPTSRHMLGLEQFKKMKQTAFIINTSCWNQQQSLIETNGIETRADLARYLGVSRARVTQVLGRLSY